jgi:hypothetical protein
MRQNLFRLAFMVTADGTIVGIVTVTFFHGIAAVRPVP